MAGLILVAMGCITIVLSAHEIMPEWVTTVFSILAIVSAGFASYFDCKRKNEINELKKKVEDLDFQVKCLKTRVNNVEDRADEKALSKYITMEQFKNKEEK